MAESVSVEAPPAAGLRAANQAPQSRSRHSKSSNKQNFKSSSFNNSPLSKSLESHVVPHVRVIKDLSDSSIVQKLPLAMEEKRGWWPPLPQQPRGVDTISLPPASLTSLSTSPSSYNHPQMDFDQFGSGTADDKMSLSDPYTSADGADGAGASDSVTVGTTLGSSSSSSSSSPPSSDAYSHLQTRYITSFFGRKSSKTQRIFQLENATRDQLELLKELITNLAYGIVGVPKAKLNEYRRLKKFILTIVNAESLTHDILKGHYDELYSVLMLTKKWIDTYVLSKTLPAPAPAPAAAAAAP